MLPPGLSFNAISDKALAASNTARLAKSFWTWQPIIEANRRGFFPYTPGTNLLYGLREALRMLDEEGMANVYARHQRHAEATRLAVRGWGLEVLCADEREHSGSLTAVMVPDGYDADKIRAVILDRFYMSLGAGLGKLAGKIFRIGHLGDFNDLMLAGTLAGVQMGLVAAGVPINNTGINAALERLQRP
jgi:alanine-glyoxylate transaminase/serine-glyoxylate transaminase/serine-pyruvate transaminase